MNRIVEALYRISGVSLLEDYTDDVILTYDTELEFLYYVASKYLKYFKYKPYYGNTKKVINLLPFYFDYTDLVGTSSDRTLEFSFLSKKYTFLKAFHIINKLCNIDDYMMRKADEKNSEYEKIQQAEEQKRKRKEIANTFPEPAKTLKMEYENQSKYGFNSLFSRDAMSYGNGFKYGDIFKKDSKLKTYANKVIGENLIKAIWRYDNDENLLLVSTPGFNFLTLYNTFMDDLSKM